MAFKFDWMWAVSADRQLSPGTKHILLHCGVFSVRNDGSTFRVRQGTVATNCGTSRKSVNEAFGDAARLGYLHKSQARLQGPGRHGGDEWTLTLPEGCNDSLQHNASESCHDSLQHNASGVTISPECCNEIDPSAVTISPECCNSADALTSADNTLTGLYTGFSNGSLSSGSGARSETASNGTEIIEADVADADIAPDLEAVCRAIGTLTRSDYTIPVDAGEVSMLAFGNRSGRNLQRCRSLMDGLVPTHLEVVSTTPTRQWRRTNEAEQDGEP